jgi:hypothetical protein
MASPFGDGRRVPQWLESRNPARHPVLRAQSSRDAGQGDFPAFVDGGVDFLPPLEQAVERAGPVQAKREFRGIRTMLRRIALLRRVLELRLCESLTMCRGVFRKRRKGSATLSATNP